MKAPEWYAEWRHAALHELMAKQDRLKATFGLGDLSRHDYDVDQGILTFSDAGGAKVRAQIQVVGTTGPKDWLWSWGNSHWPGSSCEDILSVRDFGAENGIEELVSDYVRDEDLNSLGWSLTAVAARLLDAPGGYRPARKNGGGLFLIFRSIEFLS